MYENYNSVSFVVYKDTSLLTYTTALGWYYKNIIVCDNSIIIYQATWYAYTQTEWTE